MAEVCASLNQDFHNLPVTNVMKCFTTREQCFTNSQKSDDLIYEPLTYLQLAFAETGWTTSGGNFHVEYPVKVKSHWTNEISVWYMALYPLVSLCLILVCVGDGVWVGRRCAERTYKDIKSQRLNACKLCPSGNDSFACFFGRTPSVISVSDTVEKAGNLKDSSESPPPSYSLDRLTSRVCFGLNIGRDCGFRHMTTQP